MTKNLEKQHQELTRLKLPALQARYAQVVGKPSKSPNKTFLTRAIIAALKTAEQAKPKKAPHKAKEQNEGGSFKVLPVRFDTELIVELDAAWKRHGLKTRMQLFRVALSQYLQSLGETEVAAKLAHRKAECP